MGWAAELIHRKLARQYISDWNEVENNEWTVRVGHDIMSHQELCDWCQDRGLYPTDYSLHKNANYHFTTAVFKNEEMAIMFKLQFVGGDKYKYFNFD